MLLLAYILSDLKILYDEHEYDCNEYEWYIQNSSRARFAVSWRNLLTGNAHAFLKRAEVNSISVAGFDKRFVMIIKILIMQKFEIAQLENRF